MKKTLILILLFAVSVTLSCKNIDQIIKEYSKSPQAETVNIGKMGWFMLKLFSKGNKDCKIIEKISSIYVLDMEECSTHIKNNFTEDISDLEYLDYELLMRVKDTDDNVLILAKRTKNKIKKFIVISANDPTIIKITGNFELADFADLDKIQKQYGSVDKNK